MSPHKRTVGRNRRQLPPGRHGLSRSFVAQNQRDRILAAVADTCAAEGYADMSVEDIIAHAGVSRRTFYEHFKNREHAFLAAYDAGVAQLFQRVVGAVDAADTLPAKVREGLASFLLYLANEPAFARMCIVEVLAAGPEALARRDQAMKGFATLLSENARLLMPADGPPAPELLAETIVGGIYEAVYTRIRRDEYQALPELLPDLMYGMLVPYVGPKEASGERGRIRGRTPAGQA